MRATWSLLIQKFVSNPQYWVATTNDYFTPVNHRAQFFNEQDCQVFRLCGFTLRLGFLWGLDVFPISPFLLALILKNLDFALSTSFISSIAATAARRLSTWPPRISGSGTLVFELRLGADPLLMLLQSDHLQVFQVCMTASLKA